MTTKFQQMLVSGNDQIGPSRECARKHMIVIGVLGYHPWYL